MQFPWGKVVMRGCDHQAIPPQWVGKVKMSAEGKAVLADVEEQHGEELIRSCAEIAKIHATVAEKK